MGAILQHIRVVIFVVWIAGLFAVDSVLGQTEVCDETIVLSVSSPNVTISNPFYNDSSSTLNFRVNCITNFVAIPDGMQVELIFLEVQTTGREGIAIYDHQSSTSSSFLIASFRGTLEGVPIVVSSRGGFTLSYFDLYNSQNGPGYIAEARFLDSALLPATQPGFCGGVITLTDSRPTFGFSSLVYDNPTAASSSYTAECTAHITSPSGKEVQAVLLDTQMINEYVRIYDHPSSSNAEFLVTTLYGTVQARSTVFSSRGGLTLRYSADGISSHGLGFKGEVSILDGIPNESEGLCGGVLALTDSSPNHTFTTPLYNSPSMASTEIDFTLHILCPEGKEVQLMFLDIETTTNEAISVYQYPSPPSQLLAYVSGSVDAKATVYSSGMGLTIIYQDSSDEYNGRGFMAVASIHDDLPFTLNEFAGGIINLRDASPNVSFYSPFYFQSSPDDVTFDSLIYILSPPERQVQLTFLDIDTTSSEKISVYDHPSSRSVEYRVAYIYGPLQTGVAVFSTQGGLTVVYDDSSSSRNGPGFRGVAQILDIPSAQSGLCGGTIALDQSTPMLSFSSPLYDKPSLEDVHVDCRMHITCPEGKQVRLNFLHIQTTSSQRISVYDHPASLTTRIAFFMGTLTAPSAVYSSAGGLTITYDDANDAFNGRGFLAEARILDGLPMNETGFCGGIMRLTEDSPTITFSSPTYDDPSTSDINVDCTMHFVGPTGNHIQLILNNFATTSSEEVVVFDHPSSQSEANEVSQLTGPLNARVVFFSSEEGLSLVYTDGSNSFNGPGFTAEARLLDGMDDTINPNQLGFCGGTFTLSASSPNIIFSSPTYNNPSNNAFATCTVHISSPLGKQVRVVFSNIETSGNAYETVKVYDHPTAASSNILTVSGILSSTTSVYSSRGGITLLYDDTRFPINGRGYYAEAQILDFSSSFKPGFGGGAILLTESLPQINFTTPLYKTSSTGDVEVDCTIYITSESGKQVRLGVHNFETTLNSILRVYDHPSSASSTNLISTLYGPLNASAVFLSSEGGLTLLFRDGVSSGAERGFLGEVTISDPLLSNQNGFCGGTADLTVSRPSISFSSPLYYNPSTNGLHADCSFHFTSPPEKQIMLMFLDIETTTNERISVYDHPTSTILGARIAYLYGSVKTPTTIYSSHEGLTVIFEDRSDAYNGPGFSAEARILEPPSDQAGFCGGLMALTYSIPRITFSTPIYDNPLVADVTTICRMYIRAPSRQQIKLTLRDIETNPSKQVKIYDHPTSTSSQYQVFHFYGILNGSAVIISTQGGLNIVMNDVSSLYNGKGFKAEARIYNFDEISSTEFGFCGGAIELSEASQFMTLSSPFFGNPSADTDAFINCIMHIKSSSGEQITLTFLDLNTTVNEQVRVYDHPSSTTYLLGSFRGDLQEGDAVIVSSRGGLTLVYEDDSDSANGPGFLAQAQIQDYFSDNVPGLCGGVMHITETNPSVKFATPLYGIPITSDVSLYCRFTITCLPDKHIELTLFDINIAVSGQLYIYDVPQSGSSVTVFTCYGVLNATTTILSSESRLILEYNDVIDVPPESRGFTANARITDRNTSSIDGFCGGTVSLTESFPSTTLTSPLYGHPSQFGLRLHCTMHITATLGSQVQLTFFNFETTVDVGISIYDHPSRSDYQIAYLSGKLDARTTVFSSRGGLTLTYQDDSNLSNGHGYLYEARLFDYNTSSIDGLCGGTVSLTESFPSTTFTSPLYGHPSQFGLRLHCTMHITATLGSQVQLTFFDFETTVDVGISIYDHPSSSDYQIAYLSGKLDARTTVFSSRGGLTLTYRDDSDLFNGRGYLSEARLLDTQPMALDKTCGGYIVLTPSFPRVIVTSPLYATPPLSNITMNCFWFFSNPSRNKQIEVVLKNVEISDDERIDVYRHLYLRYSFYHLASLTGLSSDSLSTSTNYVLAISLQDSSPGANGRGFLIDAKLQGTVTMTSPASSVSMETKAETFPAGQTESTQEAGAMTQTNSVTTTTETTSGPPTVPQEQPDVPSMDNTTVITASVGGLLIIVAGIVTVIVIWSRRKTTSGTTQQQQRPLPLIHAYAISSGTSQRTYELSIRPAGNHDTTEQVEGHDYAVPNNVGGSGDSDAPEHRRDNNGEGNIEGE